MKGDQITRPQSKSRKRLLFRKGRRRWSRERSGRHGLSSKGVRGDRCPGLSAAAMGNSDETLPFVTQFFRFHASYDDQGSLIGFFLQVALTLATASGAAAAAIVYLADNGNPNANWLAICQQFNDFCKKVSGAVVGSLVSVVLIVAFSAMAIKRI